MKKMFVRSILVLFGLVLTFLLLLFLVPLPWHTNLEGANARAENTCYHLKNAIHNYYTEYRTFPVLAETGDTTIDTDHELMGILLGSEKEAEEGGSNRRRIAFYAGKVAKSAGKGQFRRGVSLDESGGGQLWDPWGNHYRICYDSDRDRHIESPQYPGRLMLGSIFVWSAGKDGKFETWEDNVKSW